RLFNLPVTELDQLFSKAEAKRELNTEDANDMIKKYNSQDRLRIKTTLKLSHATDAGLNLFGQRLVRYDLNSNTINDVFYSSQDPTSTEISLDIYIDRTSVEVFVDQGVYSYSLERNENPENNEGFHFWGNNIQIKELEVFKVKSIWE